METIETVGFDAAQAFGPATPVLPPTYRPRLFGLFSAANLPDEGDVHNRNGVRANPSTHAIGKTYVDYCVRGPGEGVLDLADPDDRVKSLDPSVALIGAQPFTVYAGFQCAPVGFSQDEIEARAMQALLEGEERAVELLLQGGASANGETVHPNFTDDADSIDSGFTSVQAAIGALEEAIDEVYGGQGIILMPRRFVATLALGNEFTKAGNTLQTVLGTRVAAVVTPDNPDSGDGTLYGVGAMDIRRGPATIIGPFSSGLDRRTNGLVRLVERTYTTLIDGPLLSIGVTLSGWD